MKPFVIFAVTLMPSFVAPCVGAWIETKAVVMISTMNMMSLPAWERGLKQCKRGKQSHKVQSLPAWERGLKQKIVSIRGNPSRVAPCVGAWIETNL